MARNIANFINTHGLDGVDIDWEYPGAPDLPDIPSASLSDGNNYLALLIILKGLLPGKSISIAAPASYWYLKGFPIAKISTVVDYIIYMTYDLHGQWDFGKEWSVSDCPDGNCLRSNVNATETINALVMITKAGVPSNKVVVGVTSYGRSYEMTTPGCYSEMCTFTGIISGATKGECTNQPGYISNAEIDRILSSNRVNTKYVDSRSQSNILVYDDNQWVGYMDSATKAARTTIYKVFAMGGTTDWAVDLQEFKPAPAITVDTTWESFKMQVKMGVNPYDEVPKTGNWSSLTCNAPAALVENWGVYTQKQRWAMLDANDAWNYAIGTYKLRLKTEPHLGFSETLSQLFKKSSVMHCQVTGPGSGCSEPIGCIDRAGAGAAGYLILNSFITVHNIYQHFIDAIDSMTAHLLGTFNSFEQDFAPVPVKNTVVKDIFLGLFTLGLGMAGGAAFEIALKDLPEMVGSRLKEAGESILSPGIDAAVEIANSKPQWTADDQSDFKVLMSNATWAWKNATATGLRKMFAGGEVEITKLYSIIKDGSLASTGNIDTTTVGGELQSDIQAAVVRTFYAFAIPVAWTLSGHHPFILSSGLDCNSGQTLDGKYMLPDNKETSEACYDGKLYYLAGIPLQEDAYYYLPDGTYCPPQGGACSGSYITNKFTALPGLSTLQGSAYGAITREELVGGAVRTYIKNGGNGGLIAGMTKQSTMDDVYNRDITTPGYIRIPLCGPMEAWDNWNSKASTDNYPCN